MTNITPINTQDTTMQFASIRIVTGDVDRLAAFYERATGRIASRPTADFAEIATEVGTLAIASTRTVEGLGDDAPRPSANRSVIIEFRVADVDALWESLSQVAIDVVMEPTTMPWGNRSMLVRDPDGNLINFFAPAAT